MVTEKFRLEKRSPLPSPVLESTLKMKVLVKIRCDSSGTAPQDTVVWKSCDGRIDRDTHPFGRSNQQTFEDLLVLKYVQKQPSTDNLEFYSG